MKHTVTLLAAVLALTMAASAQVTTISQWNFNGTNATSVPGGTNSPSPSVGSGTSSLIGGTTGSFASGIANGGSTDPVTTSPPNYGWGTTTYQAQGAGSGTSGIRFDLSTAGYDTNTYTGLDIRFDLRTSNTSSRWYRVDYTVDSGANWILGNATALGSANANNGDTWHNNRVFSITDVLALDNANFGFRIVSVFSPVDFTQNNGGTNYLANTAYEVANNAPLSTSSYAPGGTWRFDMVTVQAVPEPSTYALLVLTAAGLAAYRLRRRNQ